MVNYTTSTNYGGLTAGNQPLSDFDNSFDNVARMGILMCSSTGTNAVALTPLANYPTMTAYGNYQKVGFLAPNTSTGAVTINVSSLGALNAYQADGTTAVGSGDQVSGCYYEYLYNSALNAGAGGWQSVDFYFNYSESKIAQANAISLSTGVGANVTSLVLPAGDWQVGGAIAFDVGATTTVTYFAGSSSSTSATLNATSGQDFVIQPGVVSSAVDQVFVIPTLRYSLNVSTTIYLVAQSAFAVSTATAYGMLWARRF